MKRSFNPFDACPPDSSSLTRSKNNPFLQTFDGVTVPPTRQALEHRISRLKEEMKAYESRMNTVWKPPITRRKSELSKAKDSLEAQRQVLRLEGLRPDKETCISERGKTTTRDQMATLEDKYVQRLNYMRSSLESKKREIRNVLATSRSNDPENMDSLQFSSFASPVSNRQSVADRTDLQFRLQASELQVLSRDSEVAVLRMEQTKMKAEMQEMRKRLTEVERRSSAQPFSLADGLEEPTSMRELRLQDWQENSFVRSSFGNSQRRSSQPRY